MNYVPWIDVFVYSLPILEIGLEGHLNTLARFGFISDDTQQFLFLNSCNQIWMRTCSIDATVVPAEKEKCLQMRCFGLTDVFGILTLVIPNDATCANWLKRPTKVSAPHRPSWICRRDLLYCCLCWIEFYHVYIIIVYINVTILFCVVMLPAFEWITLCLIIKEDRLLSLQ